MAEQSTPPLPEFAAKLHTSQASGQLVVRSGEVERRFLFVDGELRSARSTAEEEKFGTWLVNRVLITEDDRTGLLGKLAHEGGPPLGYLIVDAGLQERATVDRELQSLAVQIIRQAARQVPHETFYTASLEKDLPWDILPDFSTPQMIHLIAREYPETDAKRELIEARSGTTLYLTKEMDDLMAEFKLTPEEGFLLDRLRSPQSVEDLLATSGLSKVQIIDTLYSLFAADLVTPNPPAQAHQKPGAYLKQTDAESPSGDQLAERERIITLSQRVSAMNHFAALGIAPGVGHEEVVNAWREVNERCHPDRIAEPHLSDLGEELTAIQQRAELAYEVLSQPSIRSRYDRLRQSAAGIDADDGRRSAAARELVNSNLKEAKDLIDSGQNRHALTYLEGAAQVAFDEESLLSLAELLRTDTAWSRLALQMLERLTELHPECIQGWIELSRHWWRQEDAERQRKALERALALDTDSETVRALYEEHFGDDALQRALQQASPTEDTIDRE